MTTKATKATRRATYRRDLDHAAILEDLFEDVRAGKSRRYRDENGVLWTLTPIAGGIRSASKMHGKTMDVSDEALEKLISMAREGHESNGFAG